VDHALEAAVFVAWHDDEPLTSLRMASYCAGVSSRVSKHVCWPHSHRNSVSPSTSNFSFTSAIRSLISRKSHSLRTYRSS
jgi:hypothetical protein